MKSKKAKAIISSLVLMTSAFQGHADEQLQYSDLGTGEEIREGVIADNSSPENANKENSNKSKRSAKKGQIAGSKSSGSSCGTDKGSNGSCGKKSDGYLAIAVSTRPVFRSVDAAPEIEGALLKAGPI